MEGTDEKLYLSNSIWNWEKERLTKNTLKCGAGEDNINWQVVTNDIIEGKVEGLKGPQNADDS